MEFEAHPSSCGVLTADNSFCKLCTASRQPPRGLSGQTCRFNLRLTPDNRYREINTELSASRRSAQTGFQSSGLKLDVLSWWVLPSALHSAFAVVHCGTVAVTCSSGAASTRFSYEPPVQAGRRASQNLRHIAAFHQAAAAPAGFSAGSVVTHGEPSK